VFAFGCVCIAKAERHRYENVDEEVRRLQEESEMNEDDWMRSLPKEYLDALAAGGGLPEPAAADETSSSTSDDDEESSSRPSSSQVEDVKVEMAAPLTQEEAAKQLANVDFVKLAQGSAEERQTELDHMVEAASALQPCGLTIADAKPVTPVPFLLKHTLREYQHIGLDWLVSPS
jgi:E1A-binding protein p400